MLSEIIEGWRNKLIPPKELKEKINKISASRMEICKQCKFFSENKKKQGYKTLRLDEHCVSCGCTLSAKTKCLSCKCPKEFWMNEVEDENIDDEIKHLHG